MSLCLIKKFTSKFKFKHSSFDTGTYDDKRLLIVAQKTKEDKFKTNDLFVSNDEKPIDISSQENEVSTHHQTNVVIFLFWSMLIIIIVLVLNVYFEYTILFQIFKIFTSISPLDYLCKTYSSYGFLDKIDESFLVNITIEDIFRDEVDSPQILTSQKLTFDYAEQKSTTISNRQNKYSEEKCSHYSCFDLYRCGLINYNPSNLPKHLKNNILQEWIKVYVYPNYKFVDEDNIPIKFSTSLEFNRVLRAIVSSPYFTNKPQEACLFIPNIDILNFDQINAEKLERILWSLPYFRQMNGSNHLLFIMINTKQRIKQNSFHYKNAMIASGVFNDLNYRLNFDIPTPIYSLFSQLYESSDFELLPFDPSIVNKLKRKWTIVSTQFNFIPPIIRYLLSKLESFYSNRMALFGFNCTIIDATVFSNFEQLTPPFISNNKTNRKILELYNQTYVCNNDRRMRVRYLDLLHDSEFCLILKNTHGEFPLLSDALMSGCIPVIIDDNYVLPFHDFIDWNSISLRIREHSLNILLEIIDALSQKRRYHMRINALNIWNRYFRTIENISLTVLDIINQRVYPRPKNIHTTIAERFHELTPLSFDFFSKGFNYISPKNLNLLSDGFTTVILTYNRFESLNRVIASVTRVPSCVKILIIWNNQSEKPPHSDQWTSVSTPIQVITTSQNKLSNRFYPYLSIETEAIFAIDDDITMLNPDEIEFSYQTWREFPDRLVGFPSRLHYWNNITFSWKYDSEWKNKISLILTGAAFYHNYYNYLYTYTLPSKIRDWVDEHMNCEDIAMNFLVSNITAKAPIKVTPRKKFKCPECPKMNSLSADVVRHLQLRSNCVDYFANIYKMMPLKAVEFRSDPVLFRDNIPEKFKHFSLIGNL